MTVSVAPVTPDRWDDLDSEETIQDIMAALESRGHRASFLEGDPTLLDNLRKLKPDRFGDIIGQVLVGIGSGAFRILKHKGHVEPDLLHQ